MVFEALHGVKDKKFYYKCKYYKVNLRLYNHGQYLLIEGVLAPEDEQSILLETARPSALFRANTLLKEIL